MAKKQRFFKTEVDRTPYGSCVLVVLIALVVLSLGSISLWRSGGAIQRKIWPHWSQKGGSAVTIPDPFEAAQNQLNKFKEESKEQIKDAAINRIEAASDAAVDAAADAIKQEAQTEADRILPGLAP